ncbi:TonB-dependent receptor [Anaerorudis cellulosivorans]|uniref:SusC/RagA family TonB-linked outer membrane protein n=1 Tax=Anaerorudis cellulosivorans TaxID=3397862 RepID=UPI0029F56825|nr:TonB-dependent receptor [Seramator thermalis]
MAQTRMISGTITDENGQAIVGASIRIKNSQIGTVSDIDGNFSLQANPEDILVISYIGYKTQEVKVGNNTKLTIRLSEDVRMIDELVVVGYGIQRKSDLTGAISTVKPKDITAVVTTNVLESLQGRVSGVDLVKSSGQAGAGLSFTVRGERSITASNAPLILVDGIPYGSSIDLNSTDIESIEILKDASSTAIYGSKGANGVIIITTKRGKEGKTRISLNAYGGLNTVSKYPHYSNGYEYADLKREANRTTGKWSSKDDDSKIFAPLELEYLNQGQMEDFPRLLINDGYVQNYELSMSGGNNKTSYTLSLGYMNEKGIFKVNDQYGRYSGRVTLDHSIFDNFKIGANILYTYKDQDKRRDPLNMANKIVPIAKAYNDDGTINPYPSPGYPSQMNPLLDDVPGATADNVLNKRFFGTGYVDWDIINDLKFRSNVGIDFSNEREGYFYDKMTLDGAGVASSSGAYISSNSNITWENILNYSKRIKEDHNIQAMMGTSLISNTYEYYLGTGKNQPSAYTLYHFLESNSQEIRIGSDYTKTNTFSYFGRLNYKFKERYLLTASLRRDGSSVLAEGHKWASYPSVALGWRINEELFMKDVSAVSNLKLRISWGKSGNSAIDPYTTLGGLGSSQYSFNNKLALGYYPKSVPNPDLGWETTDVYDLGLDLGLFLNRISLTADVFKSYTDDLLLSRVLPMSSGYNGIMQNIGKTENTGLDLTLNTLNVNNKNFQWTTDLNFSTSKEKITQLSSGVTADIENRWFVGYPIKVFYDYKKIGIWQLDEAEEATKYGTKPGEIKVEDININGKIDIDDRVKFKQRPDFTLGMNNTFVYKDFDLSIFAYARIGQYIDYTYYKSYKA